MFLSETHTKKEGKVKSSSEYAEASNFQQVASDSVGINGHIKTDEHLSFLF